MKPSKFLVFALSVLLIVSFFFAFEMMLSSKHQQGAIIPSSISSSQSPLDTFKSETIDSAGKIRSSSDATSRDSTSNSNKLSNKDIIEDKALNPPQRSKFAYITLLSGIEPSFKYRGFLYNALIIKSVLKKFGSTADFIVLVGFKTEDISYFESDLALLRRFDIIPVLLPRWTDISHPLSFAEMALLKITPWSMTHYDRIQFLDGDVMPTKNLDCYFKLNYNTFTVGAVSPLNSGWYLAKPNLAHFEYLKERAIWRLGRDWDKTKGWKDEPMPPGIYYRGGEQLCKEWEFNGADMDQGLCFHFFILNNGDALLIDAHLRTGKVFPEGHGYKSLLTPNNEIINGILPAQIPVRDVLSCCDGKDPTQLFIHYTGRSKPWMQDLKNLSPLKKDDQFRLWCANLDGLGVPNVTCATIADLKYGAPLGFFNANFPKGGFKTVK